MSLHAFLMKLQESGQVQVANVGRAAGEELAGVDPFLEAFDRDARLEWPGRPPALDLDAARWASVMLYRACQFLACRNVPADLVMNTLSLTCPSPPSPSAAYSADLCLRFIPDVFDIAYGMAPNDTLVTSLRMLGIAWPLSSVGMSKLDDLELDLEMFWENRCLRQLYIDRIIARNDVTRLNVACVRLAVQQALGDQGERAPAIARALSQGDTAA